MAVTTIVLSVFVAFFVIGQINALPTNAPGQESKDVLQAERRRSNLRELINYLLNEDKVVIEEEAIEPVYEEYVSLLRDMS